MYHRNQIEQCLKEIRELEESFHEAQGKEILPLSFFSSSIDILIRLKTGINAIEDMQLRMMQEHLKNRDDEPWESFESKEPEYPKEPETPAELKTTDEEPAKPTEEKTILADTIGRKINTDFGKSLSLNDRFMFQRDLFHGNADEMNQAFAQLNTFQTLNEVLAFLNAKYSIPWNSDSGIAFKELLDKRFS